MVLVKYLVACVVFGRAVLSSTIIGPDVRFAPNETISVTDLDRQMLVNQINKYRSATASGSTKNQPGAQYMEEIAWDRTLEQVAEQEANQCSGDMNFAASAAYAKELSKFSGISRVEVGHNSEFVLRSRKPMSKLLGEAVDSWYSTYTSYDYGSNGCAPRDSKNWCESYKQMMLAQTRFVGCAIGVCPTLKNYPSLGQTWDSNATVIVCNFAGKRSRGLPYAKVTATDGVCSQCPSGRDNCVNNLCSGGNPPPIKKRCVKSATVRTVFKIAVNTTTTCPQYRKALLAYQPCSEPVACKIFSSGLNLLMHWRTSQSLADNFDATTYALGMDGELRKAGAIAVLE